MGETPGAPRHVAVIGAGLVGLATAVALRRDGHRVILYDRHSPEDAGRWLAASSFGNACVFAVGACLPVAMPGVLASLPRMLLDRDGPLALRPRDLPGLAPWLIAFLRSATPRQVDRIVTELGRLIRAAPAAQQRLLREAGAEHLVRRTGNLYLYRTEAGFEATRREIELRQREGVRMAFLSREEVAAREPALAPLYQKGVLFEDSWIIDTPHDYALLLLQHFRRQGGEFRLADIRAIRPEADGLRLEADPAPEPCDAVVIAAGAWSKSLARTVGDKVLLDTERGYHVLFPEAGNLLREPVCYPEYGFYMVPTREGLRCAGTVELGGLDKPPRPNRTAVIERVTRRLLPEVGKAGRTWMGFRPSMPDSLPTIGQSPRDGRIIHAYGHGHIGVTLSALTGELVADLVAGRRPRLDLSALRVDRFG